MLPVVPPTSRLTAATDRGAVKEWPKVMLDLLPTPPPRKKLSTQLDGCLRRSLSMASQIQKSLQRACDLKASSLLARFKHAVIADNEPEIGVLRLFHKTNFLQTGAGRHRSYINRRQPKVSNRFIDPSRTQPAHAIVDPRAKAVRQSCATPLCRSPLARGRREPGCGRNRKRRGRRPTTRLGCWAAPPPFR